MAEDLALEVERATGEPVVVTVAGDIDIANVGRFRDALDGAASERSVVVDLNAVTYLDSAGIAVLFAVAGRTSLQVVASPRCLVRRVLDVVALDQVATVRAV
jgi:stage II sporulation protein AA (anti-sigma F factor antagonist)